MIRDLVFDPELAKPPVGQVDLDLSAEPPFRTERKYVTTISIRIISTGSIEGRPVCE